MVPEGAAGGVDTQALVLTVMMIGWNVPSTRLDWAEVQFVVPGSLAALPVAQVRLTISGSV